MSSDSIQTTILVILMAADPKVLSVEEILKETIGGVTEQEIAEGLNDLFDKGWVQPFNPHPRNPDRPSAMLTEAGKSHLQYLVMETYAEVLRDFGRAS
jgi:DNA-binding HxlR family transcriptional regulator